MPAPSWSRTSPTRSDIPVTKVLAVGEPPLPTEMAPLAAAHFAGIADVTISHPRFLEFVAPGVSKGRAIRWLARRLRIPLGATLAIGDQWNDLEMLAEVGHGAAMPSAPAEVRAVARYIAPPVGEEGVGRAHRVARPRRAGLRPGGVATAVGRGGLGAGRRSRGVVTARIVPDDPTGRAIAVETLRDGGVVAIPTDTVYGIAVALTTPGGIERLFRVKRRPPDKGIVLLLDDAGQASRLGVIGPAAAAAGGGLLARRPDRHRPAASGRRAARRIDRGRSRRSGSACPTMRRRAPSRASSARFRRPRPTSRVSPRAATPRRSMPCSGRRSTSSSTVVRALGGPASTVVDCSGDAPRIIREGAIPSARLAGILDAAGVPHELASA